MPDAAPNAAYAAYILACLFAVLIVYLLPIFDFRGFGRIRRRRAETHVDEIDYDGASVLSPAAARRAWSEERRRAEALTVMPRGDLTLLVVLGGLGAVALGGVLGFLGPMLLDMALGARGGAWFEAGAWRADAPLPRLAQLVGALAIGLVALRMLRVFVGVAALIALAAVAQLGVNYVLGRPILQLAGV